VKIRGGMSRPSRFGGEGKSQAKKQIWKNSQERKEKCTGQTTIDF
jgi:hypothetical protein